jgi:hypothetical protein
MHPVIRILILRRRNILTSRIASHRIASPPAAALMSLVSGPGRAGTADMPAEMRLFVDQHVRYIQSLDTVRLPATVSGVCSQPMLTPPA